MYVVSLILLFFSSIIYADQEDFFEKTSARWTSSIGFSVNSKINLGEKIIKPLKTEIEVATFYYLDQTFKLHKDCLIYSLKNKNEFQNELRVVSLKLNESCSEGLFLEPYTKIKKLYSFGINIKAQKMSLVLNDKNLDYEFLNLKGEEGLRIRPSLVSLFKSDRGELLENNDICYGVDDNCNITRPDICSSCPASVIEVKSNKCKDKFTKMCSDKSCGQRNAPACIRGGSFTQEDGGYCFTDGPVGLCAPGLRVYCENKLLICR